VAPPIRAAKRLASSVMTVMGS